MRPDAVDSGIASAGYQNESSKFLEGFNLSKSKLLIEISCTDLKFEILNFMNQQSEV